MRPIVMTNEALTALRAELQQKLNAQLDETLQKLSTDRNSTKTNISLNCKLETETKVVDPVVLNFTGLAYAKQLALVNNCTSEIAWHGLVTPNEDRTVFNITDILVYPQSVTGTNVETDVAKYNEWKTALNDEQYNTLRFQAHSHVNMATSPSGVDRTLYDNILQSLGTSSYYIFLITNKKGDMFIEIYDLQNNAIYDYNDVVVTVDGVELDNWYATVYEANIAKKTYTYEYPYLAPAATTAQRGTYKPATPEKSKFGKTPWQLYLDGEGPYPGSGSLFAADDADIDRATYGVMALAAKNAAKPAAKPASEKKEQ